MYIKRTSVLFPAIVVAAALLTLAAGSNAEIYKTVDKNGNVTFSDKAPEGGEAIDVKPANTLPAITRPQQPADRAEDDDSISYSALNIVSPANDSSVDHGPGNFTVSVSVQPELDEDHRLRLYIDGAAHGRDSSKTSFSLTNVHRGTHTLQVRIIDAEGYSLMTSPTVSVHVFRPSVLQPGFRG